MAEKSRQITQLYHRTESNDYVALPIPIAELQGKLDRCEISWRSEVSADQNRWYSLEKSKVFSAPVYYIKQSDSTGSPSGPFSADEIQRRIDICQVVGETEVSRDNRTWVKLDALRKDFSVGFDVFISYSSRQRKFVKRLTAFLQSKKIRYWIDSENLPGASRGSAAWTRGIEDGINESTGFLLVHSPELIEESSTWVLDEVLSAKSKNKPILALILDKIRGSAPLGKAFTVPLQTAQQVRSFEQPEEDTFDAVLKAVNDFQDASNRKGIRVQKGPRWLLPFIGRARKAVNTTAGWLGLGSGSMALGLIIWALLRPVDPFKEWNKADLVFLDPGKSAVGLALGSDESLVNVVQTNGVTSLDQLVSYLIEQRKDVESKDRELSRLLFEQTIAGERLDARLATMVKKYRERYRPFNPEEWKDAPIVFADVKAGVGIGISRRGDGNYRTGAIYYHSDDLGKVVQVVTPQDKSQVIYNEPALAKALVEICGSDAPVIDELATRIAKLDIARNVPTLDMQPWNSAEVVLLDPDRTAVGLRREAGPDGAAGFLVVAKAQPPHLKTVMDSIRGRHAEVIANDLNLAAEAFHSGEENEQLEASLSKRLTNKFVWRKLVDPDAQIVVFRETTSTIPQVGFFQSVEQDALVYLPFGLLGPPVTVPKSTLVPGAVQLARGTQIRHSLSDVSFLQYAALMVVQSLGFKPLSEPERHLVAIQVQVDPVNNGGKDTSADVGARLVAWGRGRIATPRDLETVLGEHLKKFGVEVCDAAYVNRMIPDSSSALSTNDFVAKLYATDLVKLTITRPPPRGELHAAVDFLHYENGKSTTFWAGSTDDLLRQDGALSRPEQNFHLDSGEIVRLELPKSAIGSGKFHGYEDAAVLAPPRVSERVDHVVYLEQSENGYFYRPLFSSARYPIEGKPVRDDPSQKQVTKQHESGKAEGAWKYRAITKAQEAGEDHVNRFCFCQCLRHCLPRAGRVTEVNKQKRTAAVSMRPDAALKEGDYLIGMRPVDRTEKSFTLLAAILRVQQSHESSVDLEIAENELTNTWPEMVDLQVGDIVVRPVRTKCQIGVPRPEYVEPEPNSDVRKELQSLGNKAAQSGRMVADGRMDAGVAQAQQDVRRETLIAGQKLANKFSSAMLKLGTPTVELTDEDQSQSLGTKFDMLVAMGATHVIATYITPVAAHVERERQGRVAIDVHTFEWSIGVRRSGIPFEGKDANNAGQDGKESRLKDNWVVRVRRKQIDN